jgi:hypothetical protein
VRCRPRDDTGLVCSLLGIREKEQINYHFLKGALFETFVVSELVKSNFSVGERFGLYFWRDNHLKEIDIILESGMKQAGIEITSGKTVRSDAFAGLTYWKNLAREDSPETNRTLETELASSAGGHSMKSWFRRRCSTSTRSCSRMKEDYVLNTKAGWQSYGPKSLRIPSIDRSSSTNGQCSP